MDAKGGPEETAKMERDHRNWLIEEIFLGTLCCIGIFYQYMTYIYIYRYTHIHIYTPDISFFETVCCWYSLRLISLHNFTIFSLHMCFSAPTWPSQWLVPCWDSHFMIFQYSTHTSSFCLLSSIIIIYFTSIFQMDCLLVGGLEHFFSMIYGIIRPIWRIHIFQDVFFNHQPVCVYQ